jgi:hypothetical protein
MMTNITCQHCGQHMEFDVEQANQTVARPSVGKQTRVWSPEVGGKQNPTDQAKDTGTTMQSCPDCAELISLRALMCPKCGCATGVRFRFARDVIWNVVLVNLIFVAIGLVLFFLLWRILPLVYMPG